MSEQFNSAALQQTNETKHVEITEAQEHGRTKSLVRHDHGEHDQHKDQISTLELKLCEAVTDQRANKSLENCTNERHCKGVSKRTPEALVLEDRLIDLNRKVSRDQTYRYVNEVVSRHKRSCDLRQEREQHDVGDTYKQYQSKNPPNDVSKEVKVEETCFESFFQRRSFKIRTDLVFRFLFNNSFF